MASTWGRALRRIYYTKLLRQRGSPEYIARGVALGLLVGWAVPIGLQVVVVLLVAFLIRAAKIPAIVFTFVSNHFTIWVLYPLQCWIGGKLLGLDLSQEFIRDSLHSIVQAQTWWQSFQRFVQLGSDLGLAFVAGGLLFGVPSAIAGYFLSLYAVRRYRRYREARLAEHAAALRCADASKNKDDSQS